MTGEDHTATELLVSEHYWVDVPPDRIWERVERCRVLPTFVGGLVLPAQQTAFGFHAAGTGDGVRAAFADAGLGVGALDQGWLLLPSGWEARRITPDPETKAGP